MNTQEIKFQLKEIFQKIAPEISFEQIDTAQPLRDQAEIDSFDFYRIIVELTKRTGVNIPDSKLIEMTKLDQLMTFVSERTSSQTH